MPPAEQIHVQPAPQRLQPLVLCAIWRETAAGAPAVHGPVHANAYACLNVVTHGLVTRADGTRLPRRFVTGPLTLPLPTVVDGAMLSVSLVFQPWLLHELFGLQPLDLVDRVHPLNPVASGTPGRLLDAMAATEPGRGDALWAAMAAELPADAAGWPARLALPVLRSQGPGAAARACGLGERHYRRLFATRMGLAPRTWARLQRFEAMVQRLAVDPSLSLLAAQAGYADQAHLSREVRSVAGHSPARLRDALAQQEPGVWSLRPAQVRFVQDGEPPPA